MSELNAQNTEELRQMCAKVASGTPILPKDEELFIATLSDFECHDAVLKLLFRRIKEERAQIADFCLLIRTHYLVSSNSPWKNLFFDFVNRFELSFTKLLSLMPSMFGDASDAFLASLFEELEPHFRHTEERILCLLHIALLNETRLFDERKTKQIYEKIILLEPLNYKALCFFKTFYQYNRNWEQVANCLHLMLSLELSTDEKSLHALDLAETALHHLRDPKSCLGLLDQFCKKSNKRDLLEYQCHEALMDYEATINLLKRFLDAPQPEHRAAFIHYKIAALYLRLESYPLALEHFFTSHRKFPKFFEPLEEIIQIGVEMDQQETVTQALQLFAKSCENDATKNKVQNLVAIFSKGAIN